MQSANLQIVADEFLTPYSERN